MPTKVQFTTRQLVKFYLSKPDVYPIIGIVCCALTFMTYKGVEHLRAPDVFVDPARRSAMVYEAKFDAGEGDEWRQRVMKYYRHKDDPLRNLSIFEPLSASWWAHRKEVATKPGAVASGNNHLE